MSTSFASVVALWLSATPPSGVPDLIASFRSMSTLRAHFREQKHMSLLAAPLDSEGELDFEAPDKLARAVTAPAPSKMVIDAAGLRVWDGHRVQTVPLNGENLVARAFVYSFVHLLAGDEKALEELYAMTLTGSASSDWTLTLKPKRGLADVVDGIVVAGRGPQAKRLVVKEKGGDDTVTEFSDVVIGRPFSAAERDRTFGLPAEAR